MELWIGAGLACVGIAVGLGQWLIPHDKIDHKIRIGLIVVACATALVGLGLIVYAVIPHDQVSTAQQKNDYSNPIFENGIISPDKAFLKIHTEKLTKYTETHTIIAFCLAYDDQFPPHQDRLISKSSAQKITGSDLRIVVTLSQDLMRHGADQTHKELMCYATLMPMNVHPDEIVMHDSVRKLGGEFIGIGKGMSGDLLFIKKTVD